MVSDKIKEIWNMNTKKCSKCGEMKVHCAHGFCQDCYVKERYQTQKLEKEKK